MTPEDHGYESRLSRTEANIEALSARFVQFESTFEAAIKGIHTSLTEMRKPQWSTIGQFVGLLITIGILSLTPLWMVVNKNDASISRFQEWQLMKERELGAMEERIRAASKAAELRAAGLEIYLQRIQQENALVEARLRDIEKSRFTPEDYMLLENSHK